MHVGQIPEHVGIIDGGAAVGDLDMPPAFQRREHHEQIGDAIPRSVFVIVARWLSRFGGDRRTRLDDQLLRGFVEAHERALRIVRSLINSRTSSMVATNTTLASGGITHCCLRCGLRVFFERPPHRVVAGADNVQFDDLLLEQTQAPSGKACRGRREGQRDQFCFPAPSENPPPAKFELYLRANTASNPSSTSWAGRSTVAMLVSSAAAIRLSLQPSPASDTSAFKRMRAFVSSWAERLPLRIQPSSSSRSSALSLTTISDGNLFRATHRCHRCLAATYI